MKELYTLLPGGDLWGPYLEQSPVSPTELVDHPLKTLRGFFPAELGDVLREAVGGYAQVLLFLILSAVIALLAGGTRGWDPAGPCLCGRLRGAAVGKACRAVGRVLCADRKLEPLSSGVPARICGGSDAGRRERGRSIGQRLFPDAALFSGAGVGGRGPAAAAMLPRAEHGVLCQHRSGSFWLLQSLGRLLQKLLRWAGKLLAALLGLQRLSAWQLDRAALRTGQLLTGTIPIVGETLSDASEAVLASVQLLKSGLGLAALLTIAAEFIPVYLGMLVQLGLLSGCGVLCSLTGNARGQELLGCFAEAVRCMMAVTALFAGLAVVGTALLFVVGGG